MEGYSKEDRRKHLILQCRFYDGTNKDMYKEKLKTHEVDKSHLPSPECMKYEYTLQNEEVAKLQNASTVRFYERCWIEERIGGYNDKDRIEEYIAYGNENFSEEDGTPMSLKALLWNRYYHWGGVMSDQESFRKWYLTYYASELTNREKRAVKRRPELISKCKYYKGEEINPWTSVYTEGIDLWRKRYWDLEKQWVDALSMSFNSPLANRDFVEKLNLDFFFKTEGVALSLINHILVWHNHVEENENSSLDHDKAINRYKEIYLKYIPNK